jgi:hypothetical protein
MFYNIIEVYFFYIKNHARINIIFNYKSSNIIFISNHLKRIIYISIRWAKSLALVMDT